MGRPSRLTTERADALTQSLAAGNTISAAAETVGVGTRTVERWMERGRTAQAAVDLHLDSLTDRDRDVVATFDDDRYDRYCRLIVSAAETEYWQLWRRLTRARSTAERRAVSNIRQCANGYYWTETTTVIEERQVVIEGAIETLTHTRTTRVEKFTKDWRADAWWLERARRDDWTRQPDRIEVTGEEGGPIVTRPVEEMVAEALSLVDELAERRERAGEDQQRTG